MASEFEWTLRVSARLRYARLQIKPYGGLEVAIPPRFPRSEVPRLVEKNAAWIRAQLAKQTVLRASIELPKIINLGLDQSPVQVIYANYIQPDLLTQTETQIQVDAADDPARIKVLRDWIRQRAWVLLPPILERLSSQTGLAYNKISIRSQKSRWGSCSRRGTISLNDQLLFVPTKTVEYLMIHELCHTQHMNHSSQYWQLVGEHCPGYREQDAILGKPLELVPNWFLADLYS